MNDGALNLSDAHELSGLLDQIGSPHSEYCFANLYLFRHVHRYRFDRSAPARITGMTYDGQRHALPLVPIRNCDTIAALLDDVDCLFPIEAAVAEAARALGFSIAWNDDDSDYLYNSAKLAALTGTVMKSKRSHASRFEASERPYVEALGDENRAKALTLLDHWLADVGRPRSGTDFDACHEAILNADALGLEAIIVFAPNGDPLALLIAGPPRKDMRVVHFAKARRAFNGAHAWAVSKLAMQCGTPYLNFEQDLGHAGFRQAKRAFDPLKLVRKYRILRPA